MNTYVTGATIKELREKRNLTQADLGEQIGVSSKTISKWETGKGLPDITMLQPLAQALGISVIELLNGECVSNQNISGNMLRCKFYVCPICGNVIHTMGSALVSCCGITLPALEAEEGDADHVLNVERVEDEHFVTVSHPMTKEHYISFFAYVRSDRVLMIKLYPEQGGEVRFPLMFGGKLYFYCTQDGLFECNLTKNQ